MIRKSLPVALVILSASIGSAFAFDAFTQGPGTHIGSARDAVMDAFGVSVAVPEVVKTMAVYGLPTLNWPAFRPAELFCEATRDVDIFYFGPLYPHAQTPDFGYRKEMSAADLEGIELDALWDYLRHMAGWIDRVRGMYRDGKAREATYLLGVITHSYQDLWAHRGITNGMHKALLEHRGVDVDRDADRVAVLKERLPAWLAKLPVILGDQGSTFTSYMQSGGAVDELTLKERKRLLGRGRDLFVQGVLYVGFTTKAERTLRYLDQVQWDVDVLDGIMGDQAALGTVMGMKDKSELKQFLDARGYRFQE